MNDAAEKTLIALASPITWAWNPYTRGGGLSPRPGGQWIGETDKARYKITSPPTPDDVDAALSHRSWNLSVRLSKPVHYCTARVPTAEYAKELALHHALSGDLSEIQALDAAARVSEQAFDKKNDSDTTRLMALLRTHKPASLHWQPHRSDSLILRAPGARGEYTARFDQEQRWMVAFTRADGVREEHHFLTRLIARLACQLHAQTDEWHGML